MASVSLINLNRIIVPPIGPYAIDILGTCLEGAGHKVDVLDLTIEENPLLAIDRYFENKTPDLVGLSLRNTGDLYFPSFLDLPDKGSFLPDHMRLISKIKEHVPIDRIILGGVGYSSNPKRLLERFGLKYGVIGPGDSRFVEIANVVHHGASISGLSNDGGVFDGRKSQVVSSVKRTFVNNKWYYEFGGLAGVRTTNGCAMMCSYCIEPIAKGRGYSKRLVSDVINEIDQLVAMGIYDIHTCDSEFNMPINHAKEVLLAIIAQNYPKDVRFWAYCQPRPFDEEFAQLLAKANFAGVNFGVDHTDEKMLALMGKWYTKEDISSSTKLCKKYEIAVNHELIFGYPGDTPEKMFRAIDFLSQLDAWAMGVVIGLAVLPGTKLSQIFHERVKLGSSLEGFYICGEPLTDPTFFVDPSFKIPEIFNELKDHVGPEIRRIMVPQPNSTSSENNQLVGSIRIKNDLKKGKRGAFWYNYPSPKAAAVKKQMLAS